MLFASSTRYAASLYAQHGARRAALSDKIYEKYDAITTRSRRLSSDCRLLFTDVTSADAAPTDAAGVADIGAD
jgi:hypothetical protein